jgi:hypothetical protein
VPVKHPTKLTGSKRLRRGLYVASISIAVLAAAVAFIRTPPTSVTVDDAVADFRAQQTTSSPATTGVPSTTAAAVARAEVATTAPRAVVPRREAPTIDQSSPAPTLRRPTDGVYPYETRGGGSTDAFGGARHDYPPETPVTVRHTACGYVLRWQPLQQRWDEWEFCLTETQLVLVRITTYIEFHRQSRRDDYACDPSPANPATDRPGSRRTTVCRSADARLETTSTVVAIGHADVGGQDVPVLHVRNDTVASGSVDGKQTLDWWVHRETTLPVKLQRGADVSSNTPIGRVRYHEEYTSTARSLAPQR